MQPCRCLDQQVQISGQSDTICRTLQQFELDAKKKLYTPVKPLKQTEFRDYAKRIETRFETSVQKI
jgi:hypothetical protein